MARYQVILAYDGTDFFGFQRQAEGDKTRTVQSVVESALRRLGWQGRSILAAGRTDTGVHASGQVVAFDLDWRHTTGDLQAALNANLPPDVAVSSVSQAKADFHPRYDALRRCYRYRIFCQPVRDPLRERYAWRVWPAVDVEVMRRAERSLPGSHDFAAFGTPPRPGGTTVREVFQAEWLQEQADQLAFEISANAFLYRMVRRLVSFQVSIGQGLLDVDEFARRLGDDAGPAAVPGGLVQGLAPPQGLTLVEVIYPFEALLAE